MCGKKTVISDGFVCVCGFCYEKGKNLLAVAPARNHQETYGSKLLEELLSTCATQRMRIYHFHHFRSQFLCVHLDSQNGGQVHVLS